MTELVELFRKTLNSFYDELRNVFQDKFEIQHETSTIKSIDINSKDTILTLSKILVHHSLLISTTSSEFFEKKEVQETLFSTVDIIALFETSSEQNKKVIWKYLQTLALIAGTLVKSEISKNEIPHNTAEESSPDASENDDSRDMFDEETLGKNIEEFEGMLEDFIKQIQEDDTKTSGEDDTVEEVTDVDPEHMYNKMFKDTKIGNLAKELSNEINLDQFTDILGKNQTKHTNPNNMAPPDISNILSSLGKSGLFDMFKTVSQKIEEKLNSGDIKTDEMLKEVQDISTHMFQDPQMKKLFQSSGLSEMFKNMDFENMAKNMAHNDPNNGPGDPSEFMKNIDLNAMMKNFGASLNKNSKKPKNSKKQKGNMPSNLEQLFGNDESFDVLEEMFQTSQNTQQNPTNTPNTPQITNSFEAYKKQIDTPLKKKSHINHKSKDVKERLRAKLASKNQENSKN